MCSAVIRQFTKRIANRKDYQRLCSLLCSLIEFGGSAEAWVLINKLRQAHLRRLALREKLKQVESGIEKRQKV